MATQYSCRRYSKKSEITEIQTEHFAHTLEAPMLIITQTENASIVFLSQGSVTIRSGNHRILAQAGDILSFPRGQFYQAEWEGTPALEFYSIHYQYAIDAAQKKPGRLQCIHGMRERAEPLFSELHRILSRQTATEESSADGLRATGLFFLLFSEIYPALAIQENPYPDALIAALDYIGTHYKEDFGIGMLAENCYVSESRLYCLFRRYLATTPVHYRNERRVAEASLLLSDVSRPTVEAVAEQCGFVSANYFRTVFHEITGMSPSAFRRLGKRWE